MGEGYGLQHFPFSDSALQRDGHLLRREKQLQFGELAAVLNCGQRGSVARAQQSPKQDENGKLCKGQGEFTSRATGQAATRARVFILSLYCAGLATASQLLPKIHRAGGGRARP